MKKGLLLLPLGAYLLYKTTIKGSTPKIEGENAISELKMVPINDTQLAVQIRGTDKNNPVLLCVTGGPCGTEIPFMKKYEKELEKHFTVVHYDQRAAGKSYSFKEDYKDLNYHQHIADLISLTEYLRDYFGQDKIYLMGHSYGTYLGSLAANEKPEYYKAYIGVGQMSKLTDAEYYSLLDTIKAAEEKNNKRDVKYLESIKEKIQKGEMVVPRKYLRKYNFAEHKKTPVASEMFKALFFGPEYSLQDTFKYFYSAIKNAMPLAMQSVKDPLPELVTEAKVPTYFLLGKYDGLTNTKAAKEYFDSLGGDAPKKFIVFEESAHSPQVEENDKYVDFMCNELLEETA